MSQGAWIPTPGGLDYFRQVQRLVCTCRKTIHGKLRVGISEREAATLMKTWLQDHGVDDWSHQSLAWFGSYTSFRGFDGLRRLDDFNLTFYPGKQRLEEDVPFILDCAPILSAYTADVGYSGVPGHNLLQERLMDGLLIRRRIILDLVRERRPLAEVSQAIDRLCVIQGTLPRHKAYPFEALAHRVGKLGSHHGPSVVRFDVHNLYTLTRNTLVTGKREGWSPL